MIRTKDWLRFTLISIFFSTGAFADGSAKLVKVTRQEASATDAESGNTFATNLIFDKEISADQAKIEFINQTIQIDVANATMDSARDYQKFSEGTVKSLYTYRPDGASIRHRLILNNDQSADTFKDRVDVSANGNILTIALRNDRAANQVLKGALPPKSLDEAPAADLEAQMEKIGDAQAETDAQNKSSDQSGKSATPAEETTALATKANSEASIPVFKTADAKSGKSQNLWTRLIISIGVILAAATGLVVFAKWWNRTYKKNPMNGKIEMMTQFYLGPKRSLAIVRVAGEFILIGVTDHNITMIKTLSLIDGEFEEQLSKINQRQKDMDPLAALFSDRNDESRNLL